MKKVKICLKKIVTPLCILTLLLGPGSSHLAAQPTVNPVSKLNAKLIFSVSPELTELNEHEIALQYPSALTRPTWVFIKRQNNVRFLINYGATKASDKNLPEIKTYYEKLYKAAAKNFISSKIIYVNKRPFVLMQFETASSPGGSEFVYNYLFMTTIDGELIIFNYFFPSTDRVTELEQAGKILYSLKAGH
ncbi:MAG: hypothetical protein V4456_16205 [Bacteroidota bacterium]